MLIPQMPVFRYDEEEWEHLIEANPGWSRAETDYLLDMCERFELRFLVIADRYEVAAACPDCMRGLGLRSVVDILCATILLMSV